MIDRYKPHNNIKDTEVTWLGEVPDHWSVVALKFLVSMKSGDGITSTSIDAEGDYPVFGGNGLRGYTSKFTHDGHYVVVGRQGALCGNVNYASGKFWASEHAVVATPTRELNITWLGEMLRAMNLNQYSETAAQPGLSMEYIGNLRTVFPPLAEQQQIASFLDYETAKIDALMEKQQQLIALLGEKRQAVISHAVTKGLNPDAPMRDSGVEWLGEVPEHWKVVNLNVVAEIGNGSTPDRSNPRYWGEEGDFPWLNSSVVNQVEVNESEQFVTETALRECHLPHISPPAVLVGITGQGKTRGMATILRVEATINQHVTYIQPRNDRLTVPFIHRFFQMAYDQIRVESEGAGSTKGAITCRQLEKTKIPLPPAEEQQRVVQYIGAFATKIADLIQKAEDANELLQERRTALISAAVTGKIDVRGWKRPASEVDHDTGN